MKLIDILVEELPKRGGWPKSANCITQDGDLKVEPAYCHPSVAKCRDGGFWFLDSSRIGGFEVDTLASDYTTAIITREQYEAALAAKNDGWIEWGGGEYPPVSTNTVVDVRLRCGSVTARQLAGAMNWQSNAPDEPGDIIAYRLHHQQQADKVRSAAWNAYAGITKADDESSLNECISHDAAPVWSGEGLPPVGCFCEVEDVHGMLVYGHGESGEVIAHVENTAVIRMSYGLGCFEAVFLRPIRTESERKRDEVRKAMYAAMDIVDGDIADAIYDAIAAGKIPGVKLED